MAVDQQCYHHPDFCCITKCECYAGGRRGRCDICPTAMADEKAVPDIEERKYFTPPNFCTIEEYDCFLSGRCDTCQIARDEEAL